MPKITAKSWNRFITSNFCVSPDLMGKKHHFCFEGFDVTLSLPTMELADREPKYDHVAGVGTYRKYDEGTSLYAYRKGTETVEPINFYIEKVDVEIEVPDMISVPNEALTNPPNQYEYFSKEEIDTLRLTSSKHSLVAEKAFAYWIEIIRWSSGNAFIGQEHIQGSQSGWGTYIHEVESNHKVWVSEQSFLVTGSNEITKEHWLLAEERLQNGDTVPMHIRFLTNAEQSAKNSYFEKAIIETAMSCETYLRYSVFEYIPENVPKDLVAYIEEANINQYVNRFFKNLVPKENESEYSKIKKDINSLMNKRNDYLHMGKREGATGANCHRFINSMKKLFGIQLTKTDYKTN